MRCFFCGQCLEWHDHYIVREHPHLVDERPSDSHAANTNDLIELAKRELLARGRDEENIDMLMRTGLEDAIRKRRSAHLQGEKS